MSLADREDIIEKALALQVLFHGRGTKTRIQDTRFWSGCRERENHPNSAVLRRLPPTEIAFDAVLMLLSF